MGKQNVETTVVIDAGARYGMHPTWNSFGGDLNYLAFEPDPQEAQRLRGLNKRPDVEILSEALDKEAGEKELYITKHRGYSSFLKLDSDCEWFKRYRPGEGELESVIRVKTSTIDRFASDRGLSVDFLKVDTEGTEFDVIQGGEKQLESSVMGIRVNVNFQSCYQGQALFSEIHSYLLGKQFFLLNLDYFGRGVPRNSLFRKPDPLSEDWIRYGTLIATDAVWLKSYAVVMERLDGRPEEAAYATLKYASFCLLNHAPDVGMDVLAEFVTERGGRFSQAVCESKLYRTLRKSCAELLGKWRVYPDNQWETIRGMFKTVFGVEMEAGSRYWELLQSL